LLCCRVPAVGTDADHDMKRYWIIATAAVAAAVLYGLHRGISEGVELYIPDADGPLPRHATMMCRYPLALLSI
jgi:hypothetical protein